MSVSAEFSGPSRKEKKTALWKELEGDELFHGPPINFLGGKTPKIKENQGLTPENKKPAVPPQGKAGYFFIRV